MPDDRSTGARQALRFHRGGQRPEFHDPPRSGDRVPRPQWGRQDHHHAADPRPGLPVRRDRHRQRQALRATAGPDAPGRRAAGGGRCARRPYRPQPPALPGPDQRDRQAPGRRGARPGGPDRRGRQAVPGLLARHAAAARHRRGAARRPADPDVRRAGQRTGSRGHLVDQEPDEVAGRAGPHGARVQPPDVGVGVHRRPPPGQRARSAHPRLRHGRVHRPRLRPGRSGPDLAARRAGPGLRRRRCRRLGGPGPGGARDPRPHRGPGVRPGLRARHPAVPPRRDPGVARARLHGTDRRQRRIPRRIRRPGMTSLTIATRPGARTIASELTKIRSVRSTYWTLFVLVLASVAWCVAYCLGTVHQWPIMSAQDRAGFDATQDTILGLVLLGQLVIVVLGALMITSEYSTGMVRTSLTVMPRRGTLYAAKAAVFAAVSLVVSFVTSFGTFFLGRILLASTHAGASLSQPGVLRSVVISALYVEVCGLFAFGVGALVRNAAAALTLTYGCLALLPELIRAMPESVHNALMRWVPGGDALGVMTATMGGQRPLLFSAWGELAVFAGSAAVVLAAGAVLFSRRDA